MPKSYDPDRMKAALQSIADSTPAERKTATVFEPGCIFDSHRGHYIYPEIIKLAESEGRALDDRMIGLVESYDKDYHEESYDYEAIIEESEAAIGWLNDNRRPEGFWFGWWEGDFGLYPIENDDDDV